MVTISAVLTSALDHYLPAVRAILPASPFVLASPSAHADSSTWGRYGSVSVERFVKEAGEGAGVKGDHFPRRWRHTYATSLLRRGVDVHMVQRLMGHSNIQTTIRYNGALAAGSSRTTVVSACARSSSTEVPTRWRGHRG